MGVLYLSLGLALRLSQQVEIPFTAHDFTGFVSLSLGKVMESFRDSCPFSEDFSSVKIQSSVTMSDSRSTPSTLISPEAWSSQGRSSVCSALSYCLGHVGVVGSRRPFKAANRKQMWVLKNGTKSKELQINKEQVRCRK